MHVLRYPKRSFVGERVRQVKKRVGIERQELWGKVTCTTKHDVMTIRAKQRGKQKIPWFAELYMQLPVVVEQSAGNNGSSDGDEESKGSGALKTTDVVLNSTDVASKTTGAVPKTIDVASKTTDVVL